MSEYFQIPVSEAALNEISERGQAIYSSQLQHLNDYAQNQFVAIHIDTGDFEIGRTSAAAMRAMRQKIKADGRIFVRKIGSEPQYSLGARILQSEMLEARQK